MRNRYEKPRWIVAKYAGKCSCGGPLNKGDRVQWHPSIRRILCYRCGGQYERDLAADDFDQAQINGEWR